MCNTSFRLQIIPKVLHFVLELTKSPRTRKEKGPFQTTGWFFPDKGVPGCLDSGMLRLPGDKIIDTSPNQLPGSKATRLRITDQRGETNEFKFQIRRVRQFGRVDWIGRWEVV